MADERRGALEGDVYMGDERGGLPAPIIDAGVIGGLTRAEIDVQIATAHKFPRMVSAVKRQIETLATLDQETAEGCFYRLPRRKKVDGQWTTVFIEGASIRFAEIVLSSYGNARVASRRTDITEIDIEATGIFHDLESNVAWAKSVRRGIMTGEGDDDQGQKRTAKRFNNDMINVTTNAAASIALRNAILAGVPRGYWKGGYDKAVQAARGTAETLLIRRAKMMKAFADADVTQAQVFEVLGVRGMDDITLDLMFDGTGILNALRDRDITIAELLRESRETKEPPTLNQAFGNTPKAKDPPAGEPKAAATARTAAKPRATKASATAASTASAEPEGSGQESSQTDSRTEEKVVEFPGDRGRASVNLETGELKESGAEEQSEDDGAQEQSETRDPDVETLNAYAEAMATAEDWATVLKLVHELIVPTGQSAQALSDVMRQALLMAYGRTEALNEELFADDKIGPESDPNFYRLWLLQAPPHEVMNVFRVLMRTKAYQALDTDEQDLILDETDAAGKV